MVIFLHTCISAFEFLNWFQLSGTSLDFPGQFVLSGWDSLQRYNSQYLGLKRYDDSQHQGH